MSKQGYVYLTANKSNAVIYVGVTRDPVERVYERKNKLVKGFTAKYNVNKLVYYEVFDSIQDAISREKQIRAGSRAKKEELIRSSNPLYADLCDSL